jgi:general secretion pathway protein D
MNRTNHLVSILAACVATVILLGGCAGNLRNAAPSPGNPLQSERVDHMLSRMTPRTELQEKVKNGLAALKNGSFEQATGLFQEALRLDPANGHVHFLNALAYHMGFLSGNAKMLDLARAGYITALKFDESNAMAACLLGQIYFHQKKYREAQDQFSYGLIYSPQDLSLLQSLAVAAYYSRDLATSQRASQRAYEAAPGNPTSIRNLIFAKAASGDFTQVDTLLQQYDGASRKRALGSDPFWEDLKFERTATRVNDWKTFYASNDALIFKTPSSDIITYSPDSPEAQPAPAGVAGQPRPTANGPAAPGAKSAGAGNGARRPKMANVDVVILRTEEVRSESKGINLLDSLRTTLSGTLIEFQMVEGVSQGRSTDSRTTTIAPSLNLMDLEYNLNIFNDGVNKAEILARPSLLATEGATSNFFSGGELHVQLSSNTFDGSLVDIPIGITLNVTPTFYGDDTVEVIVHAEHSFLQMQSEMVGFSAFSQTTKTSVDATAVLKFGETLILSGLSERGSDKSSSGVPLLQDLPGIQYLFSRDEQVKSKKSILILLTPRKAAYAHETLTPEELENGMDLEKVRSADPKKKDVVANTNLNAAMAHLNLESEFYRQFRTGDMALDFWENDDSLYGSLKRVLGFLYY